MAESGILHGQVAVVTGGGSGIGRAVAESLSERGATCVLVGLRSSKLEETAAGLSTSSTTLAVDLRDPAAAGMVVDTTLTGHGRIDLIVHSAGVFAQRAVSDTDREFWDGIVDINLRATVELSRRAWPALRESNGQVVLISSIAAVQAFPGDGAYAASKAGVKALGEVMALEGRQDGIRVITICPAQVDTPLWDGKAPDEVRARMMRPHAVGDLIASLLATDRGIDILPVMIRPPVDPWQAP